MLLFFSWRIVFLIKTDNGFISINRQARPETTLTQCTCHETLYHRVPTLVLLKVACFSLQCNLDLVTLNLVTTCDLVTIFFKDHFSIFYIKTFDLVTLCDLVTVFREIKSVTKSRLHCTFISAVACQDDWKSGGRTHINVVDIIFSPGWDRVNWSAKN